MFQTQTLVVDSEHSSLYSSNLLKTNNLCAGTASVGMQIAEKTEEYGLKIATNLLLAIS